MSEIDSNRSSETHTDSTSTEIRDAADVKTLETARRWAQAVTAAEHKAIYQSSGRDYAGWLERQTEQQAS